MATVSDIISDCIGIEADLLTRDMDLAELGADSLDLMESVVALEEEFEIELQQEDISKIKSIGDVADLIQSKL